MRLWHKDLINYLPKGQLLSQWKELNSIFKNQNKHILINDVYKYHKVHLLEYSFLVIKEMYKRHFKINSFEKMSKYFSDEFPLIALTLSSGNLPKDTIDDILAECNYEKLFYKNHTEDYLVKCYFNLKEKYDCGQKDFSQAEWQAIEDKFGSRVLDEVKKQLERVKKNI